jgi:hypothetical protein
MEFDELLSETLELIRTIERCRAWLSDTSTSADGRVDRAKLEILIDLVLRETTIYLTQAQGPSSPGAEPQQPESQGDTSE